MSAKQPDLEEFNRSKLRSLRRTLQSEKWSVVQVVPQQYQTLVRYFKDSTENASTERMFNFN